MLGDRQITADFVKYRLTISLIFSALALSHFTPIFEKIEFHSQNSSIIFWRVLPLLGSHIWIHYTKLRKMTHSLSFDCFHYFQRNKLLSLAHLSQRLIGELIGYPWSGVRRRPSSSSSIRPSTISNVFSSETAWPIKAKFYVEPQWEGGMKVYINGPGHMTKMAAMPIYGKNLLNFFLRNRWTDFHETWYVASGTPAHHSLYK